MSELYHFGIKGMRWGHRKKVELTSKIDKDDAKLYGKRGAKRIKNRIVNKGMSREKARNREFARDMALVPVKALGAVAAGTAVAYMTDPLFRGTVNAMAISAIRKSRASKAGAEQVSKYLGLPTNYTASENEYMVHMAPYLEHFGIKGMRWGVRRSPEELGRKNAFDKAVVEEDYARSARKARRDRTMIDAREKAKKIAKFVGGFALSLGVTAATGYAMDHRDEIGQFVSKTAKTAVQNIKVAQFVKFNS